MLSVPLGPVIISYDKTRISTVPSVLSYGILLVCIVQTNLARDENYLELGSQLVYNTITYRVRAVFMCSLLIHTTACIRKNEYIIYIRIYTYCASLNHNAHMQQLIHTLLHAYTRTTHDTNTDLATYIYTHKSICMCTHTQTYLNV